MSQFSTISIDKKTKDKAAKRAKNDAIPVSTVVRILLSDYADGKIIIGTKMSLTGNGFDPAFEDAIIKADLEPSSEHFEEIEDAIDYLHEESKKLS
ncbi:hypothetical protein HY604_04535 [Candidatus Peregrinibacteria bacterium]|nr:hypothetical protein [Candidatus Peregrinibacteria bacterium]